jgi:hypothetical protein
VSFLNATWATTLSAGFAAIAPAFGVVGCEAVGAKGIACWAQPKHLLGWNACSAESILSC